jgi:hypothetical protein
MMNTCLTAIGEKQDLKHMLLHTRTLQVVQNIVPCHHSISHVATKIYGSRRRTATTASSKYAGCIVSAVR